MKKLLLLKEVYKEELTLLSEMSVEELADSRYSLLNIKRILPGEIDRDLDTHKNIIKILYEIEYKYNMAQKKEFRGSEKRRENVLHLLETLGKKAASLIGETFLYTFNDWCSYHWKNYNLEKVEKGEEPSNAIYVVYKRLSKFIKKHLKNITNLPFKKQLVSINLAKNMTHTIGSMMDHYRDNYGVGEDFFDYMSEHSVDKWNEELREIGVEI